MLDYVNGFSDKYYFVSILTFATQILSRLMATANEYQNLVMMKCVIDLVVEP